MKKFYIPLAVFVIIIIGMVVVILRNANKPTSSANILRLNQRADVKEAKASQKLDKKFQFPLRDESGKEVSKITFIVESAEKRDEIIVKGQPWTSVKGRTILVLNLKINNDFDKSIQINARDYLRLMVNKSDEKLAPEIHNDPVEVQAISTKYTRVGFPISDSDVNLILQVGEIKGKKELIRLNLK